MYCTEPIEKRHQPISQHIAAASRPDTPTARSCRPRPTVCDNMVGLCWFVLVLYEACPCMSCVNWIVKTWTPITTCTVFQQSKGLICLSLLYWQIGAYNFLAGHPKSVCRYFLSKSNRQPDVIANPTTIAFLPHLEYWIMMLFRYPTDPIHIGGTQWLQPHHRRITT